MERAVALKHCVDETAGPIPFVLALNKSDLREEWEADLALAEQLVAEDSTLVYTSARTGDGVEEMFRALAIRMLGKA